MKNKNITTLLHTLKLKRISAVFAPFLIIIILAGMLISGCSTGIEGTRAIKMSRSQHKEILPTEEDKFAEAFISEPLANWKIGKSFVVADSKAALIYEFPNSLNRDSITGQILKYAGYIHRPTPGGKQILTLCFNFGENKVYYPTSRSSIEELSEFCGLDLPMLIEMDMVNLADSVMKDKTFWMRSGLWYDKSGNSIKGIRFIPVVVENVHPGNSVFPLVVDFRTETGSEASVYMNIKSGTGIGAESRTFPSLFYLSNPRSNYPSVSDHVWELIKHGKVEVGMTKEECKLALGSPSEINAGHTWGNLVDYWGYKDGTYLYFEDGRLVNFRN